MAEPQQLTSLPMGLRQWAPAWCGGCAARCCCCMGTLKELVAAKGQQEETGQPRSLQHHSLTPSMRHVGACSYCAVERAGRKHLVSMMSTGLKSKLLPAWSFMQGWLPQPLSIACQKPNNYFSRRTSPPGSLPEKQEFEKVEDCQSRALTLCYRGVECTVISACGWCWDCCSKGSSRWAAVHMRFFDLSKMPPPWQPRTASSMMSLLLQIVLHIIMEDRRY